jgi:hypothetical protein
MGELNEHVQQVQEMCEDDNEVQHMVAANQSAQDGVQKIVTGFAERKVESKDVVVFGAQLKLVASALGSACSKLIVALEMSEPDQLADKGTESEIHDTLADLRARKAEVEEDIARSEGRFIV